MSEENTSEGQIPKKKRGVTLRMKLALLAVIDAKKVDYQCNYKAIGIRYRVSPDSLRTLYPIWKKGGLTLGEPETKEELRIDETVRSAKRLHLMRDTENLINDIHERRVAEAKILMGDGKTEEAIRMLSEILHLQKSMGATAETTERRQLALIDTFRRERERVELERIMDAKTVPNNPVVSAVKVEAAEEDSMRDAFRV